MRPAGVVRSGVRRCLALLGATSIVLSCGTRAELLDPTLRGCPPAPIRDVATRCNFDDPCIYSAPRLTDDRALDPNDLVCECVDGELECNQSGVACQTCDLPECPLVTAPGLRCTIESDDHERPGNSECLLEADPPTGPEEDMACACDLPGPMWRCVPAG